MSDISKVQMPSGIIYGLKDTEARKRVPETLLKSTVGWTGKNKLKTGVGTSGSIGNGTWRINSDGSVTINATLTNFGIAPWRLSTGGMNPTEALSVSDIPKGTYKIIWVNANGQKNDNIRLQIIGTNGALNAGTEIANSSTSETVTIDDTYTYYYARVWINTGTINDTIYGMLIEPEITDDTYEPYHESVEEVVEQIYADNGVLGAKNLLPNNATSQTVNGVTFTANADKSITINGTSTAIIDKQLSDYFVPTVGNYIVSKGNATPTGVSVNFSRFQNDTYINNLATLSGDKVLQNVSIDYNGYNRIKSNIFIQNGITIDNVTIYPMLRLASDPDDTYVPYAMTNRELTDAVSGKNLTISTTNNSITLGAETYCKIFGSIIIGSLQFTTSAEIAQYNTIANIAYGAVPVNKGKFMFAAISTLQDVYRVTVEAGNTSNMGIWVNGAIPAGKTCKFTFVLFV